MDYNRLVVEGAVRSFNINMAFASTLPPLKPDQIDAVKATIGAVADALQKDVPAQLPGIVSEEEVRARVEQDVRMRTASAENPIGPAFKKPLSKEELDAFLTDFRARLAESVPRAKERLAQADKLEDADEKRRDAYRASQRTMILSEICSHTFNALSQATRDQARAMDAKKFDSEYLEFHQRLGVASKRITQAGANAAGPGEVAGRKERKTAQSPPAGD